jgi:hypothetical protein
MAGLPLNQANVAYIAVKLVGKPFVQIRARRTIDYSVPATPLTALPTSLSCYAAITIF